MKNKDIIILKKILDYCNQVSEACDMFDNSFQSAWSTIQNDLPELKEEIERILNQ